MRAPVLLAVSIVFACPALAADVTVGIRSKPTGLSILFDGVAFTTPFGPAVFRRVDHQSTMGAYVGKLDVRGGKGTMVDWRYADGAKYLPPEAVAARMRPADAQA